MNRVFFNEYSCQFLSKFKMSSALEEEDDNSGMDSPVLTKRLNTPTYIESDEEEGGDEEKDEKYENKEDGEVPGSQHQYSTSPPKVKRRKPINDEEEGEYKDEDEGGYKEREMSQQYRYCSPSLPWNINKASYSHGKKQPFKFKKFVGYNSSFRPRQLRSLHHRGSPFKPFHWNKKQHRRQEEEFNQRLYSSPRSQARQRVAYSPSHPYYSPSRSRQDNFSSSYVSPSHRDYSKEMMDSQRSSYGPIYCSPSREVIRRHPPARPKRIIFAMTNGKKEIDKPIREVAKIHGYLVYDNLLPFRSMIRDQGIRGGVESRAKQLRDQMCQENPFCLLENFDHFLHKSSSGNIVVLGNYTGEAQFCMLDSIFKNKNIHATIAVQEGVKQDTLSGARFSSILEFARILCQ